MIVNLVQRSSEWYAWRRQGITSTEVDKIKPTCPKQRASLLAAKRGAPERGFMLTDEMRYGEIMEPTLRDYWQQETGLVLPPLCFEYDSWRTLRASTDGANVGSSLLIEMKCSTPEIARFDRLKPICKQHWLQIQTALLVTGCTQAVYLMYPNFARRQSEDDWQATFNPRLVRHQTIDADPETHKTILEWAEAFWSDVKRI